jgi:hypothetical protein
MLAHHTSGLFISSDLSMDLPAEVLCEKCGEPARVVTQKIDEGALAGKLSVRDTRRTDGFYFTIQCPQCGLRVQSLAPPP